MPSKVYFLNDRADRLADSIPFKGVKALRDAGLREVVKPGFRVGIKVHMGEWGSPFCLRPHWVGAVADEVKRLGGIPSVCECCTAPYGETLSRGSKADHLRTAASHGFTEEVLGCPIVICDGDFGTDDVKVDIPNGVYHRYAYIGKGMLDFDAFVVVTHFKGHSMGVYGGAIKNVGIGMASARGKLAIHNITNPKTGINTFAVDQDTVARLAGAPSPNMIDRVVANCPHGAFSYENGVLSRSSDKCGLCGFCFCFSNAGILRVHPDNTAAMPAAIADAASGFVNAIGKDRMIFLNYAFDITPMCDCVSFQDRAIVPNVGVFASRDPVAADMASMEAVEAAAAIPGSVADEYGFGEPDSERFTNCSSKAKISQWAQLNAGNYNGLGTTEYVLVHSQTEVTEEFNFPLYKNAGNANYFAAHKEVYRNLSMDPGDYLLPDGPALSVEKQSVRPKGKVKDIPKEEE